MPTRRTTVLRACILFFGITFAVAPLPAQMVGSRDLTSGWRLPSEHISIPENCEKPRSSVLDGQEGHPEGASPKDLELTIVQTWPAKLEIGNDFNAMVRLKNIGTAAVLVPSAPDGERLLRPSADGTEEVLRARAVISAVGQLNRPSLPDIPGRDAFAGPSFHSANWEHAHLDAKQPTVNLASGPLHPSQVASATFTFSTQVGATTKCSLDGAPLTSERFMEIVTALKNGMELRGRELFHPIRLALAGRAGEGELDRVILLLDEAAGLSFAVSVKSARERILEFCSASD